MYLQKNSDLGDEEEIIFCDRMHLLVWFYFKGPFDVCRKVFVGGDETAGMTLNDKSDLYFHDYNIAPLFVQENYIHVLPYAAK